MQTKRMRINPLFNPEPKTDLDRILGRNFLLKNRLINLIYKVVKSIIEISYKVQRSKIYNKIVENCIYDYRWCRIVDKKL